MRAYISFLFAAFIYSLLEFLLRLQANGWLYAVTGNCVRSQCMAFGWRRRSEAVYIDAFVRVYCVMALHGASSRLASELAPACVLCANECVCMRFVLTLLPKKGI